jgi:hypothetical protein
MIYQKLSVPLFALAIFAVLHATNVYCGTLPGTSTPPAPSTPVPPRANLLAELRAKDKEIEELKKKNTALKAEKAAKNAIPTRDSLIVDIFCGITDVRPAFVRIRNGITGKSRWFDYFFIPSSVKGVLRGYTAARLLCAGAYQNS